jgi:LytTr DNA-binding domain
MNKTLTIKYNNIERRVAIVLTLFTVAFVILTLIQDLLRAGLKKSAYYFPESFMFSSFWWLFAPLLFAQYFMLRHNNIKSLHFKFSIIIFPIVVHLFAFPFLVWLLSKAFYYHTYSFQQTLQYTLSEHLYILILFYIAPVVWFHFFTHKETPVPLSEKQKHGITNQFISTIMVGEGNKKYSIAVSEILYFSANPPYININASTKKYLHKQTLKSISLELNPNQFVRVHKSTIINIKMVDSYKTRLNGDYDLIMNNNVQLRVSRNFAADFKKLYNIIHRFTT